MAPEILHPVTCRLYRSRHRRVKGGARAGRSLRRLFLCSALLFCFCAFGPVPWCAWRSCVQRRTLCPKRHRDGFRLEIRG